MPVIPRFTDYENSLGPTSQILAGYGLLVSIKYVGKIGQNVHIFGRDKLLNEAQFAALLNATKEQARYQFRPFGLGNRERSRTTPTLFFCKPVPSFEITEHSTLSVKIARLTKGNHDLQ